MRPNYSGPVARAGLERGGVYVLATSAAAASSAPNGTRRRCRRSHQNAFDDFIAVAEDLVKRKVTTPEHLGIVGGSTAGCWWGACFVQRPELFKGRGVSGPAARHDRSNKLLAGASWMAEYGNPTPDWEFMKTWSGRTRNLNAGRTTRRSSSILDA